MRGGAPTGRQATNFFLNVLRFIYVYSTLKIHLELTMTAVQRVKNKTHT